MMKTHYTHLTHNSLPWRRHGSSENQQLGSLENAVDGACNKHSVIQSQVM